MLLHLIGDVRQTIQLRSAQRIDHNIANVRDVEHCRWTIVAVVLYDAGEIVGESAYEIRCVQMIGWFSCERIAGSMKRTK